MLAKINPALESLCKPLSELFADPKNARKHDAKNLGVIKKSLSTHGQQKPVVAMGDGKVIAGNGTLEAAKALGWERLAVVTYDDEDAAKAAAYAIVDNRSTDLSSWDLEALTAGLAEIPSTLLDSVGFTPADITELMREVDGSKSYSRKVEVPIYEPRGKSPAVSDLLDMGRATDLLTDIEKADVPEGVKGFLRTAAQRHVVFNFERIADFYASAPAEVQRLFEDSALVIVDFNKAIELGYVELTKRLAASYALEHGGANAE